MVSPLDHELAVLSCHVVKLLTYCNQLKSIIKKQYLGSDQPYSLFLTFDRSLYRVFGY